jgi:hypothetical protein
MLFDLLGNQNYKNNFDIIIDGLFSPTEKIMIAKRITIFFLILKGEEWGTIRDTIKVSLASISKCKMILINNHEIEKALEYISSRRNIKIFLDELILSLFGPGIAYINWKNAWKRKKELEQRKMEKL